MDPELRREIIMENYNHPYNKETINDDSYIKINNNSESCIDNIDLFIKINNGVIEDIKFDGEACAISTSTTSIMIKLMIGKKIEEALELINNYENMINEKEYNEDLLGEANAYNEIYKQQNRKNCAILPWNGIKKVLNEYKKVD